jgi:hypothetical protein
MFSVAPRQTTTTTRGVFVSCITRRQAKRTLYGKRGTPLDFGYFGYQKLRPK